MGSRKSPALTVVHQTPAPADNPPAAPPKRRPPQKNVSQAAAGGTKRELLVAMRDRIARQIDDPATPARDLAALTNRLMNIANDIEAIDARAEHESGETPADADDDRFDPSAI